MVEAVLPKRGHPGPIFENREIRAMVEAALLLALAAAGSLANCAALGSRATGARLRRMQRSPEWQGSHFENPQPLVNDTWAAIVSLTRPDPNLDPHSPPSTVRVDAARFAAPPPSGLRVTWMGHSTILLEKTRPGPTGTSAPNKPSRPTGACAAR